MAFLSDPAAQADTPASKQQALKGEPKPVRGAAHSEKSDEKGHPPPPRATRAQSVVLGIPQGGLSEVVRQVPLDEPPPLRPNAELKHIGKPTVRQDGRAKVTGAAQYTADIRLPGMLFGKLVNASVPHARVVAIDTSAAERLAGVRAVHVIEHVLGNAELRDKSKETASRYPIVRYTGQPVAGVAAVSQAIAGEAARLVKVQYEVMPFVVDRDAARQPNSPLVYPGAADQGGSAGGGGGPAGVPQVGNVHGPSRKKIGDVRQAFAQADAVVEGEFFTQVQTHSALETHGVVADWKPGQLTVYASTQGTSSVRDELAAIFKLPKSKVRVLTEFMGGGFGAKFGAGNVGVVATELSRKSGAPVRLMLDREEEHIVSNRPDSYQKLRLGATKDGILTAVELVSYGTAGVGTGAGTAGPAANMYKSPNLLTEEYDVFINAGPGAAFRAPGHPQGCFALEQLVDELAEKLGIDALALRDKFDENDARRWERKIGAERSHWAQRHSPGADTGAVKRGLGFAQAVWYRINNMDSACEVRVTKDGSVELLSAVQDIGGGIKTVLAQIVAEEFGLHPRDISIRIGDTNLPIGPPSGGSMTTGSITPAARNAAWLARNKFLEAIAPGMKAAAQNLTLQDGRVLSKSNPANSLTFRRAAATMATEEVAARASRAEDYKRGGARFTYGGAQFVQVAVDTESGRIHVEHVLAVHDCGRPMNPLGLQSQINGGILQGISYSLFEQRVMDQNVGRMMNLNLEQYKILGSRETPKIEIILLEDYLGQSSTDAGGIGEPSTIPTAAAIANAFYNATGKRIRRLPMTPSNVLEVLGRVATGRERA